MHAENVSKQHIEGAHEHETTVFAMKMVVGPLVFVKKMHAENMSKQYIEGAHEHETLVFRIEMAVDSLVFVKKLIVQHVFSSRKPMVRRQFP